MFVFHYKLHEMSLPVAYSIGLWPIPELTTMILSQWVKKDLLIHDPFDRTQDSLGFTPLSQSIGAMTANVSVPLRLRFIGEHQFWSLSPTANRSLMFQ